MSCAPDWFRAGAKPFSVGSARPCVSDVAGAGPVSCRPSPAWSRGHASACRSHSVSAYPGGHGAGRGPEPCSGIKHVLSNCD